MRAAAVAGRASAGRRLGEGDRNLRLSVASNSGLNGDLMHNQNNRNQGGEQNEDDTRARGGGRSRIGSDRVGGGPGLAEQAGARS